jgi:hypothetical protein
MSYYALHETASFIVSFAFSSVFPLGGAFHFIKEKERVGKKEIANADVKKHIEWR